MAMHKQVISLTDPQRVFLLGEAGRLGISTSDLVRRILDDAIGQTNAPPWKQPRWQRAPMTAEERAVAEAAKRQALMEGLAYQMEELTEQMERLKAAEKADRHE